MYQDNRHLSILDIGCGKGGDIMKYYYANIEFLVGIDPAKDGLINSFNGAISRYNNFRKGKPRFPRMDFFQGVGCALFNYDDQFRSLGGLSFDDKKLMEKYFSKDPAKRVMFDRISSQFAVHYMFRTRETLDNFKQNLNDYLKPGGYFICTCFDATRVVELFGETDKFSTYYTNEKGEKKLFWQIIRKFDKKGKDEVFEEGNAIDFFGAWMFQEGQFETEYLVDKKFIEKEFMDCGLELIDTDLFDNQYRMHKEFITKYAQYESVDETRKFMMSVKEFYDEEESDINKGCIINDSITRYYVFRKKHDFKPEKVQKGGNIMDFEDETKYYIHKFEETDNSLHRSIHEILQTHKIVPKGEKFKDFFKSFDIKIPRSMNTLYDMKAIQELGNKIVIEHELENGDKKKAIDGISVITVEKVGGKYNIEKPKKLKKANIMLLKENGSYKPIYEIDEKFNKKAIFNKNEINV